MSPQDKVTGTAEKTDEHLHTVNSHSPIAAPRKPLDDDLRTVNSHSPIAAPRKPLDDDLRTVNSHSPIAAPRTAEQAGDEGATAVPHPAHAADPADEAGEPEAAPVA
ncbi:hypothetical protein ACFV3R_15810 [Streptomyces sp. NPDC059740]|uniref:hypothetical protein n=1 Tax=Streptomyces sp. NPDC059740 TaxID=3346926 RepID=UPI0036554F62